MGINGQFFVATVELPEGSCCAGYILNHSYLLLFNVIYPSSYLTMIIHVYVPHYIPMFAWYHLIKKKNTNALKNHPLLLARRSRPKCSRIPMWPGPSFKPWRGRGAQARLVPSAGGSPVAGWSMVLVKHENDWKRIDSGATPILRKPYSMQWSNMWNVKGKSWIWECHGIGLERIKVEPLWWLWILKIHCSYLCGHICHKISLKHFDSYTNI